MSVDSLFMEARRFQIEEICKAFGASPEEVVPQAMEWRAIRAAIFELELQFVATMIQGIQKRLENAEDER
jgi:hypothetical protein